MKYRELLSGFSLSNSLVLKNRIVMAPMTRCFSDEDLAPTGDMAKYYAGRAGAGLIITEATLIDPQGQGYPRTPGIYSRKQIDAWKKVTAAVHDNGGHIFCQLWHTGRMAHSSYTGSQPVAPSSIGLEGPLPRAPGLHYEVPRTLDREEIGELVELYARAASHAIEAGFDGVEIHAANGYLIDQFLHQQTNQRSDEYGADAENRSRFALQVVDAVAAVTRPHRTAIRLSPQAYVNLEYTEGDEATFDVLLQALNERLLAYVHVASFDADLGYEYLGGRPVDYVRRRYKGTVVGCGGFSPEAAESALADWQMNLVAFGRSFIANPDLVGKIRSGASLAAYEESLLGALV